MKLFRTFITNNMVLDYQKKTSIMSLIVIRNFAMKRSCWRNGNFVVWTCILM